MLVIFLTKASLKLPLVNFFRFIYFFQQVLCCVSHSCFDYQERNLTFVKTAFQVLKLKFFAFSMKQAFYPLYK